MALPEQLLLSDLLRRRVRCDQGLERGPGLMVWMHPPVHRLLGWVSRPSLFGGSRLVWRLNQLRGLVELEALVKGEPAETDQATLDRLPTLMEAVLLSRDHQPIGSLADLVFEPATGRIRHYLVSRSDPRLPGSSRWRLVPERIVDQQPGRVLTSVSCLDDLPLARSSVRQQLLRRSRRWRERVQQAGEQFETRLEGWLEEQPAWEAEDRRPPAAAGPSRGDDGPEPWDGDDWQPLPQPRHRRRSPSPDADEDPWV